MSGDMPAEDQSGPALAVLLDDARQVVIQPAFKEEVCLGHGKALHYCCQLHWTDLLPEGKDAMAGNIQPFSNVLDVVYSG